MKIYDDYDEIKDRKARTIALQCFKEDWTCRHFLDVIGNDESLHWGVILYLDILYKKGKLGIDFE